MSAAEKHGRLGQAAWRSCRSYGSSTVLWDERLKTGHERLDVQHAWLHALVAELGGIALQSPERELLDDLLSEILRDAAVHFADEEALMRRVGYPDLPRHRALHAGFLAEIEELASGRGSCAERIPATEMHAFMNDWLRLHVWEEDLRITEHIGAQSRARISSPSAAPQGGLQ